MMKETLMGGLNRSCARRWGLTDRPYALSGMRRGNGRQIYIFKCLHME